MGYNVANNTLVTSPKMPVTNYYDTLTSLALSILFYQIFAFFLIFFGEFFHMSGDYSESSLSSSIR